MATTNNITNSLPITTISCPTINQKNKPYIPFEQLNASEISRLLGWTRDPHGNTLCGGRYVDPSNITNTPHPKPMQDTPLNITSNKNASFISHGTSVITGDVTLIQPGREITADCVTFFRDNSGKLHNGVLVGHVKFHEYGKLILAERYNLNFVNAEHTSDNVFYRLLASTPSGLTNIWGQAKHAVRDAMGVLKMWRATYSACPPDATSWHLWSNKLTLDRNTGRGSAVNAFLFFKKIPVFYTPYFSFPLDKRRKSGFLFPDIIYSHDSGYSLALPYYFNLAPNYDATFTPTFFTKRGVLFSGLFNYLTTINSGNISVKYIPYDEAFANFRNTASSENQPALAALKTSSSERAFLSLENSTHFNEYWKGALNLNYVTDDYFLLDFSSATTAINKDQLFNQAALSYANEHWRFSSQLQGFQTLHPITRQNIKSVASSW